MTVAVAVKVFDGIVLAADSATTLNLGNGSAQVYNNANKVFHLHRSLPIGAMTWGLGAIANASIATLAKDLRRRLMGLDPRHTDWTLQDDYTIEQVAQRVIEMFYDELWLSQPVQPPPQTVLGMLIAGYSGDGQHAEAWELYLSSDGEPELTQLIGAEAWGWKAFAQPAATERLFDGIDPYLDHQIRQELGADYARIAPLIGAAARQPVHPAMPFGDAIALAQVLVETTANYSHFLLGPDTVGGQIEVAGINRHEGFRWISRKHYYTQSLNPAETNHDH